MTEAEFQSMMAGIAQGVVNISEGLTTIEADSVIHAAMARLCDAVTEGKVGLLDQPPVKHRIAIVGLPKRMRIDDAIGELHRILDDCNVAKAFTYCTRIHNDGVCEIDADDITIVELRRVGFYVDVLS